MKYSNIDFCGYNTLLQPTEWRFSSSIVGLVGFLEYIGAEYDYLYNIEERPDIYINGFDGLLYNQEDITEEKFLDYVEYYFSADMPHLKIVEILSSEDINDEQIKLVGEMIKSKTVLKNTLKGISVTRENAGTIIDKLNANRYEVIKSIYRYGKNLYSCFCNSNLLLSSDGQHCRLLGYTVDEGRKSRSLGFCFSKDSFDGNDILEFDFIPFAFSNSDMFETYFINNNYSIESLILTNQTLSEKLSASTEPSFTKDKSRERLFTVLKNSKQFIDYDVEIITKSRDDDYFETLFVRSKKLKALKEIKEVSLKFSCNYGGDYWLNLEKEVYERCLNDILLDDLIIFMLKLYSSNDKSVNKTTVKYRTDVLIKINASWKISMNLIGGEIMTDIELAKKTGFLTAKKLEEMGRKNKVTSYRQKIIGTLVAHDYDRLKEVLLSLSSYVDMEFAFFYKLLENTEDNLDIAFAFASALTVKEN